LPDTNLPMGGPGRASDGNFVLTNFTLAYGAPGSVETPHTVKLINPQANFEQAGFTAAMVLDDKPETGWAVSPQVGKPHLITFDIPAEVKIPAGAPLRVQLEQRHADTHTIGRFRLSTATAHAADSLDSDPGRKELVATRDRLSREVASPIPLAIAMTEGGTPGGLFPNIQDVPIHIRGSYTRLGPIVPRRLPRILAGDSQPAITVGSGRRELANWVASQRNPLTARVIVNRVWQWHFGEGLVRTPSNFGKLGEASSHPELLDWLAAKFIEEGWSLKKLHRRILASAVYQQSSRGTAEGVEQDPENRWLARFSPRRLEAEAIRDAVLFVSGRLEPSAGGPAGDDLTIPQRSLYVQTARWDRSGYATLFDAANPDSSTEKRVVSTVAPQALLLLNHEFILGQAKHLAGRWLRESPTDETHRIQLAYQQLFGRPASDAELQIARRVIAQGGTADPVAGWTDLAHVLLCCNEFVYLE
ncbi:MAG: DUF1553 domain-containing protein, partial [Planctomycetota bacterium]|nr:DUF1553 domain-containing protein [Planctomycetota bacterium]